MAPGGEAEATTAPQHRHRLRRIPATATTSRAAVINTLSHDKHVLCRVRYYKYRTNSFLRKTIGYLWRCNIPASGHWSGQLAASCNMHPAPCTMPLYCIHPFVPNFLPDHTLGTHCQTAGVHRSAPRAPSKRAPTLPIPSCRRQWLPRRDAIAVNWPSLALMRILTVLLPPNQAGHMTGSAQLQMHDRGASSTWTLPHLLYRYDTASALAKTTTTCTDPKDSSKRSLCRPATVVVFLASVMPQILTYSTTNRWLTNGRTLMLGQ